MNKAIKVLLADDHVVVRAGTRQLLERHPDITIIGEASDGYEVVQLATDLEPDVVLMDVRMPLLNGIDASRLICSAHPDVHVLGMSVHHEMTIVDDFLAAGATTGNRINVITLSWVKEIGPGGANII